MFEVLTSIGRVVSGLRDWEFENFVAQDLIRIIYLLSVVLGAVGVVIVSLTTLFNGYYGFFAKIGMIIGYIVGYLITVLGARMGSEMALILFRIEKNTRCGEAE